MQNTWGSSADLGLMPQLKEKDLINKIEICKSLKLKYASIKLTYPIKNNEHRYSKISILLSTWLLTS